MPRLTLSNVWASVAMSEFSAVLLATACGLSLSWY